MAQSKPVPPEGGVRPASTADRPRRTGRALTAALVVALLLVVPAAGATGGVTGSSSTDGAPDASATARVERVGGADRWGTAALIADRVSTTATRRAYVASGEDFADALAASAAAASAIELPTHGHYAAAPLLLTKAGALPTATVRALETMTLDGIVLVGGSTAVSPAVKRDLERFAPVTRVAGADRYDTAARVWEHKSPPDPNPSYLASGRTFPDALSAAALAARPRTGPGTSHANAVLLTKPGLLPAPTQAVLLRNRHMPVWAFGGEQAVPTSQLDHIESNLGISDPVRIAGADRYATSARVSALFPPRPPAVVIASGTNYPDALAGATLAGSHGGPLLLTRPDGVPAVVMAELERLSPQRVILLGGTSSVTRAVEDQLNARLPHWRQ